MEGTQLYHIARYTLTGRRLGEDTFKTREEAKNFMRHYLYKKFYSWPAEDFIDKVFEDVEKNKGVYRFFYGDIYFFITKIKSDSELVS